MDNSQSKNKRKNKLTRAEKAALKEAARRKVQPLLFDEFTEFEMVGG